MNRILSSIAGFLNGFLAFALIIGAVVGGAALDAGVTGGTALGAGVTGGLIVGLVLAVSFCGMFATFITMRDELTNIRQLLSQESKMV